MASEGQGDNRSRQRQDRGKGGRFKHKRRGGGAGSNPESSKRPEREAQDARGRSDDAGGKHRPQKNNRQVDRAKGAGGGTTAPRREASSSESLLKSLGREIKLPVDGPKESLAPKVKRRYGVAFYDTFAQAKADLSTIKAQSELVDQLNLVIRAEGNMDDPDLVGIGRVKVFAGTAWTIIHERRKSEGWYEQAH